MDLDTILNHEGIPSEIKKGLVRRIEELKSTIVELKQRENILTKTLDDQKKIEDALEESERRYRLILNNIEVGYYEVDLYGNFKFFNDALCEMFGYSKNEILGMNYKYYTDEETAVRVFKTFNEVFNTGNPSKAFNWLAIGKNGKRWYAETSVSLITNSKGEKTGFRGILSNITERKRVEEALQERALLIEKMAEGVLVEDTNGIVIFTNPRTCSMLGYSEEEIRGKHWSYLVLKDDHTRAQRETAMRSKGIENTYEITAVAKDGRQIPIIVTATPLFSKEGEFKGVLDVFTDISDRKQAEEALKQIKLEEERYHAMLTHFINNDFQKITSLVEMVSERYKTNNELRISDLEKIISIAIRSSKTIERVNKIFALLQFPVIKFTETYSLLGIITDIEKELNLEYKGYQIEIDQRTIDISVLCDEYLKDLVREILFFIFDDRRGEKTPLKSALIKGEHFSKHYTLHIHDYSSTPIKEEILKMITGKITEDWEYRGHYIGLTLAAAIMHYYGGSLVIKPQNQRGNEFDLCFPLILIK